MSFVLFAFLFNACLFEPEQGVEPVTPPVVTEKKNPFTVENVTKALQNVAARSAGRIQVDPLAPTHNYVRFEPQNLDQIMLLDYLGYELWDEPLDQEIDYTGDYYQQPGLPDSLNYFYTLVPINYQVTTEVPYTVISQVALFDENAGDEQDPEDDPWVPDPNCPDPNNPNCPCYEGPCARQKGSYTPETPEDMIKKTTKYLLDAGVNLVELYNEMMLLAGYPDDVIETSSSGRTMGYRPSGCLTVSDNSVSSNTVVPLKNVLVKSKRWFKLDRVWTNSSGCFTAGKEFRKKAKVIVKFKNSMAVVRGINGALKLWQYVFPLKKKLGLYERSEMQNISYNFQYASDANTLTALRFAAAHSLNTLADIRQFATTHGLLGFAPGTEYAINIWISSVHTQGAAAPMIRAITNSSQVVATLQYLFPGVVSRVIDVLKKYSPDITMRLQAAGSSNTRFSADINGTFFHEFGHTIHYNKVGNNYWADLIWAIVTSGGYGNKNSSNSGIIAVAESWGFFIGRTFNANRYNSSMFTFANDQRAQLEFQIPSNTEAVQFPTSSTSTGWIPFGMPHDLIDTGEPATGVIDNVSNYTINSIFKGYNTSATTVQTLRQQILSQNNNNQSTQVNQLVSSYGW